MAKNRALKVGIEDGEVVIRIGVGVLRTAAEAYEGFSDGEGEKVLRIFDPARFAEAIVRELQDEEEDGTTLVHVMFDKAFHHAVDMGDALGCEIVEPADFRALVKRFPNLGLAALERKTLADERSRAKAKAIEQGAL